MTWNAASIICKIILMSSYVLKFVLCSYCLWTLPKLRQKCILGQWDILEQISCTMILLLTFIDLPCEIFSYQILVQTCEIKYYIVCRKWDWDLFRGLMNIVSTCLLWRWRISQITKSLNLALFWWWCRWFCTQSLNLALCHCYICNATFIIWCRISNQVCGVF